MPATSAQVRCPSCGSPVQTTIEQLVDVAQDPASKTRLLSGSLNLLRCPTCGYEGQLSTPIVYHDPAKELLLTYIPVEVGLKKDDQERLLGQLINQAISRLPADQRKGYLFQPQAVLTLQSMVERVLEADGITKEDLEAQRELMRLFEELLRTPDEQMEAFVQAHDDKLGPEFFQLAAYALRAASDEAAGRAGEQKLESALGASSYGKRLESQEAELRLAAESLRQTGTELNRERLLTLFDEAPNPDRVAALVSLVRPALDYAFFSLLSERIDSASGTDKDRLTALRSQMLEITEEIDKIQEARVAQTAGLLKSIMQAEDLDRAVSASLPYVDELFLGILQANIKAAEERSDRATLDRLHQVDDRIRQALLASVPPGLQLAERALQAESPEEAEALLKASAADIDEQTLGALLATAQQMEQTQQDQQASAMRDLHRQALRLSMQAKMKGDDGATGG